MRCTLLYYKGVRRENYMCEFGIAEVVQKVCGVNKHIPKVGGMPDTQSTVQRLMAALLRMDCCSIQDWLFNLENY